MKFSVLLLLLTLIVTGSEIDEGELAMIEAGAPEEPRVTPTQQRSVLLFSRSWGYRHSSIPYGVAAINALAKVTGAFEVTATDDLDQFEKENLDRFDAIIFNNTNNEIFLPEEFDALGEEERRQAEERDLRLKANLVSFIRGGKGLVVLHAGVASFRKWPEFGDIMGARFDNHPWNSGSTVTLKVSEPEHPVAAAFRDHPHLEITDEIYQLKEGGSNGDARILVQVDMERSTVTEQQRKLLHRTDNTFAISYVRNYGEGRVFYCALGHQHDVFWNSVFLQHVLDGIQFAIGDLQGDAQPMGR